LLVFQEKRVLMDGILLAYEGQVPVSTPKANELSSSASGELQVE
jgi:hypothetical protein